MNEVLEKIQKTGIVPVVVLDDARDAAPLARADCPARKSRSVQKPQKNPSVS